MFNKEIEAIYSFIEHNWKDKAENLIIGIDGLSRAGKTSFCNQLVFILESTEIPIIIFPLDDFITPKAIRYNTLRPSWEEHYFLQWDITFLKENLFSKIKTASQIDLPIYNSELDKQEMKSICLPENCLIIIEGVFLQRPEWKLYIDKYIFLDCPRDIRFSRESIETQQNIEKFEQRYWKAEDYYLENINPKLKADLFIEI